MKKAARRVAVTLGAATVGVLAVAGPAAAHVTITPDEAVAGERARVDFRVPNESDTASTVELEIHFPEETPISSASVGIVPGWTAEITNRSLDTPIEGPEGEQITEVVDVIAWTAEDEDAGIGPGEFGEFPVSLGPLPEAEQLSFPTLQTYSDGEVSRWIELPTEGVEPQEPAPTLTLTVGQPAEDGNAPADGSDDTGDQPQSADEDPDSGSSTGTWLGLAGLVAGLAGLALGGVAFARTRQSS